jgi:hypothetical protein
MSDETCVTKSAHTQTHSQGGKNKSNENASCCVYAAWCVVLSLSKGGFEKFLPRQTYELWNLQKSFFFFCTYFFLVFSPFTQVFHVMDLRMTQKKGAFILPFSGE